MDSSEILNSYAATKGKTPKPEQAEAFDQLCEGRDVLVVAATGFGKSLVAQAYTFARHELGSGMTVCVNPLIALSADQHREAKEWGLRSDIWNSTRTDKQKEAIAAAISAGEIDILFTTPESLRATELQHVLAGNVGLAWIDESHSAISEKDFRHAWGRVGQIIDKVNPRVRYACTATLETRVEEEAIQRCGLNNPHIIRLSADRNFEFRHIERTTSAIKAAIREHANEKVLIYTATVKACETIRAELEMSGADALAYNGQLAKKRRKEIQDAFTKGEAKTVVCTDSFALGVNIPDIRAVICFDPAKDVAAFVQQAGRAGRDGQLSTIYLCSRNAYEGWRSREFLIKSGFPEVNDMELVWNFIKSYGPDGIEDTQQGIAKLAGVAHWKFGASSIFSQLKQRGLVRERHEGKKYTWMAAGHFGIQNWMDYTARLPHALSGLKELRGLWDQPECEIRESIKQFFAEESAEAAA